MASLKEKFMKIFFPHRRMKDVMVHDGCGGWIAEIESVAGIQLMCFKCKKKWEGYWCMGEQPVYHIEWHPEKKVNKFYEE